MIASDEVHRQLNASQAPYLFDTGYTRDVYHYAKERTQAQSRRMRKFAEAMRFLVCPEVREEARIVSFNDEAANADYPLNYVRSAKYTLLNAVPKFCLEQFGRFANLYFLVVGVLYLIEGVSPTDAGSRFGQIISLSIVLLITAVKEGYEDYFRHREDIRLNRSSTEVVGPKGSCRWGQLRVGDVVRVYDKQYLPADVVLLASSSEDGLVYVETKQLDGESNLKVKVATTELMALFSSEAAALATAGRLECDPPNDRLYEFRGVVYIESEGEDKPVAVGYDQFLPRGCKLRNTEWVHGLVIYTADDTKIQRNGKQKPRKRSTVERTLDKLLAATLVVQLVLAAVMTSISAAQCHRRLNDGNNSWYLLPDESSCNPIDFFALFFTYIVLTSNFVPLALYVSMEIARLFQSGFIMMDAKLYDPDRGMRLTVRTSNLNEDCGMVSYLFSDKTGTLTSNNMIFKKYVIDGTVYEEEPANASAETIASLRNDLETISKPENNWGNGHAEVELFRLLAMCNSIVLEEGRYVGTSPDEVALVEACQDMGYVFEGRTNKDLTIKVCGREEHWELLGVLEFNSARKRMSVIVRSPHDRKIRIYCKGADFTIFQLLAEGQELAAERLKPVLDEFATSGLRILCMCYREVEPEDFSEWYREFASCQALTEGRDQALEDVVAKIEAGMVLLGATAIEDALQEGVPETLRALEYAGIKTWVLTGDKQETAVNIGISCGLLDEVSNVTVINESTKEDTEAQMDRAIGVWRALSQEMDWDHTHFSLVVDGNTLQFVLNTELEKKLVLLGKMCKTVLACRVTPKQKTELVEAVRKYEKKKVTMAIGDGANDVGMIRAAHVGVGIVGVEGLEAKLASDFSCTQFRFLQRLLIVHGRWNYRRMTRMSLYVIYKSIAIAMMEIFYQFYNDLSGSLYVDPLVAGLYNVFLTAVPVVMFAAYDRDVSANYALQFPEIYKRGQKNAAISVRTFGWWFGLAIFHAGAAFFLPVWCSFDYPEANGRLTGQAAQAGLSFFILLLTADLFLAVGVNSWNWYTFAIWFFFTTFWFYGGLIFSSAAVSFYAGLNPLWLNTYQEVYSSGTAWLLVLLGVTVGVAPVVLKNYLQRNYFFHEKTLVQELMYRGLQRSDVFPPQPPQRTRVLDRRGVEYPLRDMLTFDVDEAGGGLHDRFNPVIGIMNRHRRLKRTLSDSNLQQNVVTDIAEEKSNQGHRRNFTVAF